MTKRERFLVHCMKFHGLPYIWGGADPKVGLDCSGLAQHLLAWHKIDPPGDQTADVLMKYFSKPENGKKVGLADLDLGDLIFFGNIKTGRSNHIALGLFDGLMFEAGGGGSTCTSPEIARKLGASVRVSNISRRVDLLCVLRPRGILW